jgi:PIN domain nuclease of toxin-antitoxin system
MRYLIDTNVFIRIIEDYENTIYVRSESIKEFIHRLTISQAITEIIPLISSERKFPKYRKSGLVFIPNY